VPAPAGVPVLSSSINNIRSSTISMSLSSVITLSLLVMLSIRPAATRTGQWNHVTTSR
jgi:hypothetical protein